VPDRCKSNLLETNNVDKLEHQTLHMNQDHKHGKLPYLSLNKSAESKIRCI
jgi:hypothetical protein